MHSEVLKYIVIPALGALSAGAAHRNIAIYHDGLRTSVRELEQGRTRPELGAYAYTISIGFVVAYALPFALASGILTIHMILLGTDVIGVRSRRLAEAVAAGAAWSAAIVAVVDLFVRGVERLPLATTGEQLLWLPLVYSLPLLGAATAMEAFGFRAGVIAAAVTLALWALAWLLLHPPFPHAVTPFGSGLIAFAIVMAGLVTIAARERAPEPPDTAFFEDNIRRIRRNWPALVPAAALIAVTGSYQWVAGEPAQVALLGSNHLEGAAMIALFSTLGFLPLQGMTGLVSGVWNPHGYPDWILGAGYLVSNPVGAAAAGGGLMVVELLTLRRVAVILTSRPGVTSLGNAVRGALDIVPMLALLAGAVLAAAAVAGPVGPFVVIAASMLNDKRGRPVVPLAAPVIGYLVVLLGTGFAHELGLFS
jgi:hypothetical protein